MENSQKQSSFSATEKKFYKTMIDSLQEAIHIIDSDFHIITVNKKLRQWCKNINVELDLRKRKLKEVFPFLSEEIFNQYKQVIETGLSLITQEKTEINGQSIFTESKKIPVMNDEKVQAVITILHDITDQVKTKEKLKENEKKYRTLFNESRNGIFMIKPEGAFLDANKAFCNMLGYTIKEVKKLKGFLQLIPKKWHNKEKEEIWNNSLLKKGYSGIYKTEFIKKDGTIFPVELQSFMVSEEAEKKRYIWGIARDITERKKAEDTMRFMAYMLDEAPGSITVHNFEGNFLYANRKTFELHGYDKNEFMKLKLQDIDIPESKALIEKRMSLIEQQGEASFEVKHFRKDGTEFPLEISVKKIEWEGIPAILSIATDITEKKQAEEEQKKLQEQLLQAQKMESVGRLAGGVAHDFNNMLGVILCHVELSLDEVKPFHPLYSNLKNIQKAAARSADITRQLLAFARKQTIAPRLQNLNKTISNMIKMLGRLIGENIKLTMLPGKDLWNVRIDPTQVDQILANLCVNAKDSISNTGEIIIETRNITFDEKYCTTHAGVLPGSYVMLSVSDNGCGMDENTLQNIFEPFFTTKKIGEGTGLGLSTVYGIVKQNKGFVNVYSKPGKGTTFKIYLPKFTKKDLHCKNNLIPEHPLHGNETILLVEDEPMILEITTRVLKNLGYRVLSARKPAEAIKQAGDYGEKIHLLITDVIMPKMNGRELAEKILLLYPEIKCLYMSGYTANVIAYHGVLLEGVNFIPKPFSRHELAKKVRQAIDGKPKNITGLSQK